MINSVMTPLSLMPQTDEAGIALLSRPLTFGLQAVKNVLQAYQMRWAVLMKTLVVVAFCVFSPCINVHSQIVFNNVTSTSGTSSLNSFNLDNGQSSVAVSGLDFPSGIAFDSSGDIYFINNTSSPTQASLCEFIQGTGLQDLGQILDVSGGFMVGGWAYSVAVNGARQVFYTTPSIVSGGAVVVEAGTISMFDPATEETSTVVRNLNYPSGLAFDISGNIYFLNVSYSPLQASLFELPIGGTLKIIGANGHYLFGESSSWSLVVFPCSREFGEHIFYHAEYLHYHATAIVNSSGTISMFNVTTGDISTVVSNPIYPSGVVFDPADNMFFGNVTTSPAGASLEELPVSGSIIDLGSVWAPNGGIFPSGWAFDISVWSVLDYTVALSASPPGDGAVNGGGTFASGTSQTVTATPNNGYTFENWTQNGSVVST